MRPVSLAEIGLFARVLVTANGRDRMRLACDLLAEVEMAGRHLQVSGCSHPEFGDGSPMARCWSLSPFPEPSDVDPTFLAAMISACEALRRHSEL